MIHSAKKECSRQLIWQMIDKACARIFDVGCGSGMSTLALRNRFPKAEIIGVDLSAAMPENAKKLLSDVQWILKRENR